MVGIILGGQLRLQSGNRFIGQIIQLCPNQLPAGIPQRNQRFDTGQCAGAGLHGAHFGILAIINCVIFNNIAEISRVGVGIERAAFLLLVFVVIRQRVLALQIGKGRVKLTFQRRAIFQRCAGGALSVGAADHLHLTADHLGMVDEIPVQRNAIGSLAYMNPWRVLLQDPPALLQEQNVRGDRRPGLCGKGIVGQPHRADQITAGGQIPAYAFGLFIHRAGGRYKRHNAADAEFIYGFGKKVIVDLKVQLVVLTVRDLILPKRHIANG